MIRIIDEGCWKWHLPDDEGVVIEKGFVLYPGMQGKDYCPFDFPNLPNRLASVQTEKDVIHFAERYGVLGYQNLVGKTRAGDVWFKGDPVNWFLLHAKTVKFALNLTHAVQSEMKDQDIKRLIFQNTIKIPLNRVELWARDLPDDATVPAHYFAVEGDKDQIHPLIQTDTWEGHHDSIAIQIVSLLVNSNTRGIARAIGQKRRKSKAEQYCFSQQFKARCLIEAIWYHVGDAALNIQGRSTRICKECGLPFVVTDNRQEFCPGDMYSSGSLCGARWRVRKKRERDKKKRRKTHVNRT